MDKDVGNSTASFLEDLEYIDAVSGSNNSDFRGFQRRKWPSLVFTIPLILGLVGFIFNILALLVFTASKNFRRSSFRCYIYAFVLANCVSILTHSWFYLLLYVFEPKVLCKYTLYLQQSVSTTSLWITILLSLERSFTFARPFTVKKLFKSRTICAFLLVVVVLCFAVHIDELVLSESVAFEWVNFAYGMCSMNRRLRMSHPRIKIVTHLLSFAVPFLLNSILDVYISYKICKRRHNLLTGSSSNSLNTKSRRSRMSLANEITIALLCQSIWLLFTYFPSRLYYSLVSFDVIRDYDDTLIIFLIRQNLLIYLAFSPTLYVILSQTLRREILQQLCGFYPHSQSRSSSYLSSVSRRSKRQPPNAYRQLPGHAGTHSTITKSRSVELPRRPLPPRLPMRPTILPKHSIDYKSKSAPHLSSSSTDENELVRKTGRSFTVHD